MIELLANDGYIVVNKKIISKIGLQESVMLGELCSEYLYWRKQGKLKDNFFYSTRDNLKKNTGLSDYQQRFVIKNLISNGLIKEKYAGQPPLKWYSVCAKNIEILIKEVYRKEPLDLSLKKLKTKDLNNLISRPKETEVLRVKKLNANNNNIIIIKNSNKSSYLRKEKKIEEEEGKRNTIAKFKKNIEYEILIQDKEISAIIEDIIKVVKEVLVSRKKNIPINSEVKSLQEVKKQLLKINTGHIQYIIESINKNTKDIKNIKSYILTVLYNSVTTLNLNTGFQVSRITNDEEKGVDSYD